MKKSQLFQVSPWITTGDSRILEYFTDYCGTIFSKGHIFYCQEENSDYVYLIREGRVCLSIDNMNGDMKDIFIADAGFIFGKLSAFDDMGNCCYAIVVSDTARVSLIPKKVFHEKLETDNQFCLEVAAMMAKTIRTLISQIRLLSFNSSKAKVCYALYHLSNQYADADKNTCKINMKFTHQEIGELVGLSRVSVSAALSGMVKEGILKKKDGYYYIFDLEAIYRAISEEIYNDAD